MTRSEFLAMKPHDLWAVASALRGPDFQPLDNQPGTKEVLKLKLATTAVIRFYAGFSIESVVFGFDCNEDSEEHAALRRSFDGKLGDFAWGAAHPGLSHFLMHVRSAFTALKLDWRGTNTTMTTRSTP